MPPSKSQENGRLNAKRAKNRATLAPADAEFAYFFAPD